MLPLSHPSRRRSRLLWAAGTALLGLAVYKAYQSETVTNKRKELNDRLDRFMETVQNYSDAMISGGRVFSVLLKDLLTFLTSDQEEIPQSIRQLTRLLRSPEAVLTVKTYVQAAMESASDEPDVEKGPTAMGLLERLLFSDRGQNLVSLVVARAARETVATVLENLGDQPASPPLAEFLTDRSIGFLSTHAGREVAVQAVSALVASAVSVYLDKTSAEPVLERLVAQTLVKDDTRKALEQVMGYVGKEVVTTMLSPIKSPAPAPSRRWEEGHAPAAASHTRPRTPANAPGREARGLRATPLEGANVSASADFDAFSRLAPASPRNDLRLSVPALSYQALGEEASSSKGPSRAPLSRKDAEGAAAGRPGMPSSASDAALHRMNLQQPPQQLRHGAVQPTVAAAPEGAWQAGVVRQVLQLAMQPEGRILVREVAGSVTAEAMKTFLSYVNPFSRMHWAAKNGQGGATTAGVEVGRSGVRAYVRAETDALPPSRTRGAIVKAGSSPRVCVYPDVDTEDGNSADTSALTVASSRGETGAGNSKGSPMWPRRAASSVAWLASQALSTGSAAALELDLMR